MKIWSRLRSLLVRGKIDREMTEEMRLHLEQRTRDHIAAGMAPDDARDAALKKFGGVEQAKERCREQQPFAWVEHLGRDLRLAWRQLRKAPGFALTAVLTVTIGIGACTALFSVVNGVLLRPLRFTESERMVTLEETRPPKTGESVRGVMPPSPGVYLDWVEQTTAFAHLAANAGRSFNLRLDGKVLRVPALAFTADYLRVLGVDPLIGRNFLPEEMTPGRDRVALLSYRTWQDRYGGKPDVLGQTIALDDAPFTIIGVLPDRDLQWNGFVFVPLVFGPEVRADYGSHGGFGVIARLKPGVTLAQAQTDLDLVSERIARAHPESNLGHGALARELLDALTGHVREQLWITLGAVGLVLLIACVNVASLLLARANARQREIAVRAALGASRSRIVRQFLVESLLVCALGGVFGTALAYGCMGAIARFVSAYVPRTQEIALDGNVLAVGVGLVFVTGVLVGLVPALQFTRGDLADPLKDGGRGSSAGRLRQRLRSTLVVVEIALAVVLLVGAGLLARSLAALQRAHQGFDPQRVYQTTLGLNGARYSGPEKGNAFYNELLTRVGALPEVESVAIANGMPTFGVRGLLFHVLGTPEVPVKDAPNTQAYIVSPDYFRTLGIPLLRGRGFTADDRKGAPRVCVINQELARRHFNGVDPVGQRLMIMTMADTPDAVREIVGVVGDVRPQGPQSELHPQVYEPAAQFSMSWANLVVKAKGAAPGLPAAVSEIVASMDSDLPPRTLRPFELALANSWFRQRFSMTLFTAFSAIALLLAAIGIYGVMAYNVAQRTPEIGIRMALGARAADVLRLVLAGGGKMVGLGLILGVAGSLAFARVLEAMLYRTSTADPVTLLAVAAVLAVVALLACWVPARRATNVNPMVALRAE